MVGAARSHWADLEDSHVGDDPVQLRPEELIDEADAINITIRMEEGRSVCLAMQPRYIVCRLCSYIE